MNYVFCIVLYFHFLHHVFCLIQDTVMALQALSQFVSVVNFGEGASSLTLTVTGSGSFVPKTFQINSNINLLVLQQQQVKTEDTYITRIICNIMMYKYIYIDICNICLLSIYVSSVDDPQAYNSLQIVQFYTKTVQSDFFIWRLLWNSKKKYCNALLDTLLLGKKDCTKAPYVSTQPLQGSVYMVLPYVLCLTLILLRFCLSISLSF